MIDYCYSLHSPQSLKNVWEKQHILMSIDSWCSPRSLIYLCARQATHFNDTVVTHSITCVFNLSPCYHIHSTHINDRHPLSLQSLIYFVNKQAHNYIFYAFFLRTCLIKNAILFLLFMNTDSVIVVVNIGICHETEQATKQVCPWKPKTVTPFYVWKPFFFKIN